MTPRAPRRDAVLNKERVVQAALRAIARHGLNVPVLAIAEEAGVGVATFYRSFPDRRALMHELALRAYDRLLVIIGGIEADGVESLAAVDRFLREPLAIADELILPLHGAEPFVDDAAVDKRDRIFTALERFLAQGRQAGAVRSDANATDIIVCSALVTQPLSLGPYWERVAGRHIALFIAGLASDSALPAPPVALADVKAALRDRAEGDQRR